MFNKVIVPVVILIKCGVKEFCQVLKRLDQVKKKDARRRKRRNYDRKKGNEKEKEFLKRQNFEKNINKSNEGTHTIEKDVSNRHQIACSAFLYIWYVCHFVRANDFGKYCE